MIFLALITAFVTGGLFTWYFVGGHFATKAFEYREEWHASMRLATRMQLSRDQAREAWMLWEARARDLGWSDSPKDATFWERTHRVDESFSRLKAPSNE